jgi:hypothetical protein
MHNLTVLGLEAQDNVLMKDRDPSYHAQVVIRSSFGGLLAAMFGMGWLGMGLGAAHAFKPLVIVLFDIFGIALLGCSIYFIRKGRSLRRKCPASSDLLLRKIDRQFMVIAIVEVAAIAIVSGIAYAFHRPDLAPVLVAIVVGLHFLLLGKVFQQASYYRWGTAIMLWCGICAIVLRGNTLVVWSNIGTGILLWGTCTHGLLEARRIVRET